MKWIKIALGVLAVLIVVPVLALAIAGASPNSNRIATAVVIRQKPVAARFMTPLVCWQAKKKMLGDLEQLRSRLEGSL